MPVALSLLEAVSVRALPFHAIVIAVATASDKIPNRFIFSPPPMWYLECPDPSDCKPGDLSAQAAPWIAVEDRSPSEIRIGEMSAMASRQGVARVSAAILVTARRDLGDTRGTAG